VIANEALPTALALLEVVFGISFDDRLVKILSIRHR
jgi:hypothetical protein